MKLYQFILIISTLFFVSCEELDSDIDIKAGESKLVLSGFISPSDTAIRIYLSQTQPMIGPNLDPNVRNAKVTISDGTNVDTLFYFEDEQVYYLEKQVRSNTSYTVRAELPDGRWAEATCTTLEQVALDFTYTIDSVIRDNKIEYTVKMNWIDNSTNGNVYYRTDAEMYYLIVDTVTQVYQFITTELNPNISEVNKAAGFNQSMEVIYKSNFEVKDVEKYLELHLLMIDEDYYKFEQTKRNNFSGLGTFDYSKMYSNVKNGLGIVASYNNQVMKPININ
jgi:Domain of unknown function (DUF4249)